MSATSKSDHTIGSISVKKLSLQLSAVELQKSLSLIKAAMSVQYKNSGKYLDTNTVPKAVPITYEQAVYELADTHFKHYVFSMPYKPTPPSPPKGAGGANDAKGAGDHKPPVSASSTSSAHIVIFKDEGKYLDLSKLDDEERKFIRQHSQVAISDSKKKCDRMNKDYDEDNDRMFNELKLCLLDSTFESLKRIPTFEDTYKTRCPFEFFTLIKNHLSAGGLSSSKFIAGSTAIKKWNSWAWSNEDKSVDSYLERGRLFVTNLKDATGEVVSDNMFARRFVDGLFAEPIFAKMKERLLQEEANGTWDVKNLKLDVLTKGATAYYEAIKTTPDSVTTVLFAGPAHNKGNSHQKTCSVSTCKASNPVKFLFCSQCGHKFDSNSGKGAKQGNSNPPKPPNPKSGGKKQQAQNPPAPATSGAASTIGIASFGTSCVAGFYDDDEYDIPVFQAYLANSNSPKRTPNSIILDSGSNVSIVHPKFLKNIRKAKSPISVVGINGDQFTVDTVGDLEGVITCYASDIPPVSILSLKEINDASSLSFDPGFGFIAAFQDFNIMFKIVDGHFVANFGEWTKPISNSVYEKEVFLISVADAKLRYSRKELELADSAYKFMKNLGYGTPTRAKAFISSGDIAGIHFTGRDIDNACDIYGLVPEVIRGSDPKKAVKSAKEDHTSINPEIVQSMYIDILVIAEYKQHYLISILHPCGYIYSSRLPDRTEPTIFKHVVLHVNHAGGMKVQIRKIYTDPEKSFVKLSTTRFESAVLKNIPMDICGAADHLNIIDRAIRDVKNVFRSFYDAMNSIFKVAPKIIEPIVICSVCRTNDYRGCRDVAPAILLGGILPRFDFEYGISPGTYCETHRPNNVSNNACDPRTEACLALYPTHNANGSWVFLNITTGRLITRSSWKVLNMPQHIIDALNADAVANGYTPLKFEDNEPTSAPTQSAVVTNSASDFITSGDAVVVPMEGARLEGDSKPFVSSGDPNVTNSETISSIGDNLVTNSIPDSSPADIPSADTVIAHDNAVSIPDAEIIAPTKSSKFDEPAAASTHSMTLRNRRTAHYLNSSKCIIAEVFQLSLKKGINIYGKVATDAINKELSQMLSKGVWGYVKHLNGAKYIRSCLILKEKLDEKGNLAQLKARLVADGSQQIMEIYETVSSPTVSAFSTMLVLKIAMVEKRTICVADIAGAYLNANMDADVFMKLDSTVAKVMVDVDPSSKEFLQPDGSLFVKLKKALYGCRQSGLLWFKHLSTFLMKLKFVANSQDKCVFNLIREDVQITIAFHVDDVLITSVKESNVKWLLSELKSEFKEIKEQSGKLLTYLGLQLEKSDSGDKLFVTMNNLYEDVIKGRKRGVSTPAQNDLFKTGESELLSDPIKKEFHSMVAKLLYLARMVRPDIMFAVAFLTTRVAIPNQNDLAKLNRILDYLYGTKNLKFIISNVGFDNVSSMIDASFAKHKDAMSHTGYIITVGGTPILFGSSKQKIITTNSTDAELVAVSDKFLHTMKIHNFIVSQGYKLNSPIIFQDNMSVITIIKSADHNHTNKYMHVRSENIKLFLNNEDIKIEYLPTKQMLADVFTKPLQGELFNEMRSKLLGDETDEKVRSK